MTRLLQISNILALAFMLVLNFLANYLPIAGKTTGELSDLYPNLFVPAGLTFSIWGLIYLLLLGFTIVQARGLFGRASRAPAFVTSLGWLFVYNGIFNGTWILFWHYEFVFVALLIMLAILVTLILIYQRLVVTYQPESTAEKYLVQLPFRIYLGWIIIATVANVTTWLISIDWGGMGLSTPLWTIIAIALGTLINLLFVLRYRDPWLPLVGVWAFLGIYLKRSAAEPLYESVVTAAVAAGIILLIASLTALVRGRRTTS